MRESKKVDLLNTVYQSGQDTDKVYWLQYLTVKNPLVGRLLVEKNKPSQITFEDQGEFSTDLRKNIRKIQKALIFGYQYYLLDSKKQAEKFFLSAGRLSKRIGFALDMLLVQNGSNENEAYQQRYSPFYEDVLRSRNPNFDQRINSHEGLIQRLETLKNIADEGEKTRSLELARIEFQDWIFILSKS